MVCAGLNLVWAEVSGRFQGGKLRLRPMAPALAGRAVILQAFGPAILDSDERDGRDYRDGRDGMDCMDDMDGWDRLK